MMKSFSALRRLYLFAASAASLSVLPLMAGCSHSSLASTPSASSLPESILIGVDRSESTRPMRSQFFDQMDRATNMAISQDLPIDVWAYDRSALPLYGPRKPQSHNDLDQIKRTELAPNDAHLRTKTRPAVLLEAWEHDKTFHHVTGTYAIILTDGDAEVADDEPRLVAAAKALGSDPSFHMAVVDINPENRKMWDNALGKGMPGRYVLAGQAESTTALTQFLQGKTRQ